MKNLLKIIIVLALTLNCYAQEIINNDSIFTIKVKPIKPKVKPIDCLDELNLFKKGSLQAFVFEFDVIETKDTLIYGKKIYAIAPCFEYLIENSFYDGKDRIDQYLQISLNQHYRIKYLISNENLLKKNKSKKKYFIKYVTSGRKRFIKPRCP